MSYTGAALVHLLATTPMAPELRQLYLLRDELVTMEGGAMFMGLPDRWFEAPGPKFRCTQGHVSTCILKSTLHGDLCLNCQEPLMLTFPEDIDDPLPGPNPQKPDVTSTLPWFHPLTEEDMERCARLEARVLIGEASADDLAEFRRLRDLIPPPIDVDVK